MQEIAFLTNLGVFIGRRKLRARLPSAMLSSKRFMIGTYLSGRNVRLESVAVPHDFSTQAAGFGHYRTLQDAIELPNQQFVRQ